MRRGAVAGLLALALALVLPGPGRAADPAADVGTQCTLAANADTQKFLRAYATQAGVPCAVDQAKVLGQSGDGAIVYEIGCSDAAG
mgnify:CR=1 FL=1